MLLETRARSPAYPPYPLGISAMTEFFMTAAFLLMAVAVVAGTLASLLLG